MNDEKPDWRAIRQFYVNSHEGLRPVARRFGVLLTTLAKRARREGWATERYLARRFPTVTPPSEAMHEVRASESLAQRSARLRERIGSVCEVDLGIIEQSAPKVLADAGARQAVLSELVKTGRAVLGWGEEPEAPRVRIDVMKAVVMVGSSPAPAAEGAITEQS